MIPAAIDANRDLVLARAADVLAGLRLPGGGVAAWLAGVPAMLIEHALEEEDPAAAARVLFRLVGRFAHAGHKGLLCGFEDCDTTNVPQGAFADAALRLWATCSLARLHLDRGAPGPAAQLTIPLLRALTGMPARLAAQFGERVDALHVEALTALAVDRADEVA